MFLIDCGEGAQVLLKRYRISKGRLDNILISHLHGDHVFGIFGILSTMALDGRTAPLFIYAPRDFGSLLRFFLSHFGEGVKYEITHIPLNMKEPEEIASFRHCRVYAFPLNHRIDCFGFRIVYEKMPRMTASDSSEAVPYIKSFAYCSDTAVFPEEAEWLKGTDLIYHEATFADEHIDLAHRMYHSTAREAALVALKAGASKLVLGHFSSRYSDLSILENQAREVFPESYLAIEGASFEV
ncbi:MAG: ribonuclease Z [Bacteroidales bacterium]|nr:ribonuclease Z [Candidatus Cacconaster merdequi]